MQVFRFTRVTMVAVAAVIAMGAALVMGQHPAAAQDDPTATPLVTSEPGDDEPLATAEPVDGEPLATAGPQDDEPFSQADLTSFTGGVARPNGMVWLDEMLYVVCEGDGTVYKLYGTSGETDTYIYGVQDAHSIYAEQSRIGIVSLWVPDYQAGALLHITAVGVDEVATGLAGPWGIAPLGSSVFLVSNELAETVEIVSRDGERQIFAEDLDRPTGLAYSDGTVYVANSGDPDRAIEWYPLGTVTDDEPATGAVLVEGLNDVMAVQLGPDDNLYFAYDEDGVGVIGRVDPEECRENGGCTLDDVEQVVVTDLAAPLAGLTFASDGRLFFHERYGEELFWVQAIE